MTKNSKPLQARQFGISLIELVIVIAVVSILASIAVPSYREYVLRTNRMEAINILLNVAACQERGFMKFNQYATTRCLTPNTTPNGTYVVTMATSNANQNFTLTATPQSAQVNDSCGNLTLNDQGARGTSVSSVATVVADCWRGKKVAVEEAS